MHITKVASFRWLTRRISACGTKSHMTIGTPGADSLHLCSISITKKFSEKQHSCDSA